MVRVGEVPIKEGIYWQQTDTRGVTVTFGAGRGRGLSVDLFGGRARGSVEEGRRGGGRVCERGCVCVREGVCRCYW